MLDNIVSKFINNLLNIGSEYVIIDLNISNRILNVELFK